MNRLTASMLSLALAAMTGPALAQSYPASPGYDQGSYQSGGAQYDYARVVRVDPVLDGGYGNGVLAGNQAQRCRTERSGYAGGSYGTSGNYGSDDYRNDDYRNDDHVGAGSNTARTVATVIGGVLGAAIGSQVGGGSARYATSAIGSMVGGMAGREVYQASQRNRVPPRSGAVTVCDPVPAGGNYHAGDARGVSAYDVTYEYAGRTYMTRTDYHPGDRIRVRVDVRAD